jgi:hypothetical protein
VGTGIGKTQQQIMRLVRNKRGFHTTAQLAAELNRSQQQVYRAVRSLAARGEVELTLEPNLRIWMPGATKARREYWASMNTRFPQLRRPGHCGPECDRTHVGPDKQHWA